MIEHLRPLTKEQRQGAHQSASEAVLRAIGPTPIREHFAGETISRFRVSVTGLITVNRPLWGENHALDEESGIFCVWRYNPGLTGSLCGDAISADRVPGG